MGAIKRSADSSRRIIMKKDESIEQILDEMLRDNDDPGDVTKPVVMWYAQRIERALRKHDVELLIKAFQKENLKK